MEKADECATLEISVLPPRKLPILSGALPLYRGLIVLQVSNSQVDCYGTEALSTALTMQELHLNNLCIPGDAVRKLALGFKGNSALLNVTVTCVWWMRKVQRVWHMHSHARKPQGLKRDDNKLPAA